MCMGEQPRAREQVFEKLFAIDPTWRDLFVLDFDGGVRRAMFQTSCDIIQNYVDNDPMAEARIEAGQLIHDGYGVTPEVFQLFFKLISEAVQIHHRVHHADTWNRTHTAAWDAMLAHFKTIK